jgi:eukaryotic-like serine/threonine-protein kinase
MSGYHDMPVSCQLLRHRPDMLEQVGRYQIQSELGRGAMGIVYRARDPLIDRAVAIKTIRVDLPADELALFEARFFTEVRAAGSLNHANIVTIHDAGKEGALVYVAMELLEGPSLADLLLAHTPVPPARIANIGAQIADALAYAHGRGIVHRDVKPANIILVRDRLPKLTDFGVARLPNASTTLGGTIVGSPKYMSPEQVATQPVDGRSDVFSLGVVLYELLTGESPFAGADLHAVMRRVVHHDPPAPAVLNPRVPAALDAIVQRSMAKRPDERYPSARAFAADLTRFARGELVTLGTAPTPASRSRPVPGVGDETIELRPAAQPQLAETNSDAATADTQEPPPARRPFRRAAVLAGIPLMGFVAALVFSGAGRMPTHPAVALPSASGPIATSAVATATEAPAPARATAPLPYEMADSPATAPSDPPTDDADAAAPAQESAHPAAPTPKRRAPSIREPVRTASASPPANAAPAHAAPEAKLIFAIAPWGEIYVDGQRVGVTPPLRELSVPAGRRKVEIRNADLAPHVVMLDLREHSAVRIKYQFR